MSHRQSPSLLPKSQRILLGIALPKMYGRLDRECKDILQGRKSHYGTRCEGRRLPSRGKKFSLPREKTFRRERKSKHPGHVNIFHPIPHATPMRQAYNCHSQYTSPRPRLSRNVNPDGLHGEIRHLTANRRHDFLPRRLPGWKHGGHNHRYQFHGKIRLFPKWHRSLDDQALPSSYMSPNCLLIEYGRNDPSIQYQGQGEIHSTFSWGTICHYGHLSLIKQESQDLQKR